MWHRRSTSLVHAVCLCPLDLFEPKLVVPPLPDDALLLVLLDTVDTSAEGMMGSSGSMASWVRPMARCPIATRAQEHVRGCFSKSVQFSAEDGIALLLNCSRLLCVSLIGVRQKRHMASSSRSLNGHMTQAIMLLELLHSTALCCSAQ